MSNILSNDMTGTSGSSDNKMVIFSVPVFSGASVIGVLTAAINVDKISMLENINIPYSGTFLCLIDGNNSIVEYSGSFLREFPHLTRSFNFFSPLSTLIESDDCFSLKKNLPALAGTVINITKAVKMTGSFHSRPFPIQTDGSSSRFRRKTASDHSKTACSSKSAL